MSIAPSGNPGFEMFEMSTVKYPDGFRTPAVVVEGDGDTTNGCGDVHRGTSNRLHNSGTCYSKGHTFEHFAGMVEETVDKTVEPALTVCITSGACDPKTTIPGLCL